MRPHSPSGTSYQTAGTLVRAGGFIALVVFGSACSAPEAREPLGARPIAWAKATQMAQTPRTVALTGITAPVDSSTASFEIGGKVVELAVDVGDTLKPGQVIAQLDARAIRNEIALLGAQLAEARVRAVDARRERNRAAALVSSNAAPRQGLDQAETVAEAASARIRAARASVARARVTLDQTTLTSPYAGRVVRRLVERSEVVAPGQPVVEIYSTGLEVAFTAPETLLGSVQPGTSLTVHAPGETHLNAVVVDVGAHDRASGGYPVRARLDAPGDLESGRTVSVEVHRNDGAVVQEGGVEIPLAALVPDGEQTYRVFVFDSRAGVVRERKVQLGVISHGKAVLTDGLEADEVVATRGTSFLRDGEPVVLLKP
ncbi:MAG: efflux RND transporter periplasmic adaptor subunit, partial [Myxococcota bacterium]